MLSWRAYGSKLIFLRTCHMLFSQVQTSSNKPIQTGPYVCVFLFVMYECDCVLKIVQCDILIKI